MWKWDNENNTWYVSLEMYIKKVNKMIWKSITTVVDTTTGEIITQKKVKNGDYVIIKKEITHEINSTKTHGTRKIKWLCEPNRQGKLF